MEHQSTGHFLRSATLLKSAQPIGFALAALFLLAYLQVMTRGSSSPTKEGQTEVEVVTIEETVHRVYPSGRGYAGIGAASLAATNSIPSKWIRTRPGMDSRLTNPFGGDVLVASVDSGRHFAVSVTGLPQGACKKLIGLTIRTSSMAVFNGLPDLTKAMKEADATGCSSPEGNIVTFVSN